MNDPDADDGTASIASLVERWRAEGLAAEPATPHQLDEVEAAIGAPLPAAMRALYLAVNGTESYPDDWLMLLPLDIVVGAAHRDGDTVWLTFGDFMESLHTVMLQLGPDVQRVWRGDATGGRTELAPDFASFLARAAANTRALFA